MTSRRRCRHPLTATTLVLAVLLSGLAPVSVVASDVHDTIAKTRYGKLRGAINGEALVWRGVPYAKPPVGELRWRAPQNPDPWKGMRDATTSAPPCTQLLTSAEWIRQAQAVGSEDCLYVDVYRPRRPAWHTESLPVYVWIHGGSNNFGAANNYDGSTLATQSDVVVVVVQYRLGPIGWFFHPAVQTGGADALSDSGNFGTLDHAQALRWIRDNIKGFGGNPDNVTITGESAGAHNVMNMVISPVGDGLFHRAMSESGGMYTKSTAYARGAADKTIEQVIRYLEGVDGPTAKARRLAMESTGTLDAYLRAIDAGKFFRAVFAFTGTLPTYDGIEDGTVIPVGGWIPAIRAGHYNHVPIILGSNQYETKAFMPLYGPTVKLFFGVPSGLYSYFNLIDVLKGHLKADHTPFTLADVLPLEHDQHLYEISGYYGSRNWKAKYVDTVAHELAQVQDDVYAYLFKWGGNGSGPAPFAFIYGAGHSAEIPFFLGAGSVVAWGDNGLFGYPFVPANEGGRTELRSAMMAYLAAFARTGNPNAPGSELPKWQKWSNVVGGSKAISFDADLDQANIAMTTEELTVEGVTEELDAAISTLPSNEKGAARLFQFSPPW